MRNMNVSEGRVCVAGENTKARVDVCVVRARVVCGTSSPNGTSAKRTRLSLSLTKKDAVACLFFLCVWRVGCRRVRAARNVHHREGDTGAVKDHAVLRPNPRSLVVPVRKH